MPINILKIILDQNVLKFFLVNVNLDCLISITKSLLCFIHQSSGDEVVVPPTSARVKVVTPLIATLVLSRESVSIRTIRWANPLTQDQSPYIHCDATRGATRICIQSLLQYKSYVNKKYK